MAVSIRLARHGSKKNPFYRIVVADSRSPRDGRRIEQVGYYDPRTNPSRIEFREERLFHWLQRGARPTTTVAHLMRKKGIRLASAARPTAPSGEASS